MRLVLDMNRCLIFLLFGLLADGCVQFHPQPLSPEQPTAEFDSRSLTNTGLEAFLGTNEALPGTDRLSVADFLKRTDLNGPFPEASLRDCRRRAGHVESRGDGAEPEPAPASKQISVSARTRMHAVFRW